MTSAHDRRGRREIVTTFAQGSRKVANDETHLELLGRLGELPLHLGQLALEARHGALQLLGRLPLRLKLRLGLARVGLQRLDLRPPKQSKDGRRNVR